MNADALRGAGDGRDDRERPTFDGAGFRAFLARLSPPIRLTPAQQDIVERIARGEEPVMLGLRHRIAGEDAAAWLRAAMVHDILRLAHVTPSNLGRTPEDAMDQSPQDASGPMMKVVTTVRCVSAETCGSRFEVGYLPVALPGCVRCGGRTVLVKVVRDAGPALNREGEW